MNKILAICVVIDGERNPDAYIIDTAKLDKKKDLVWIKHIESNGESKSPEDTDALDKAKVEKFPVSVDGIITCYVGFSEHCPSSSDYLIK